MFKEFMMRAMLAKQLKGVPKEQQEQIISAISKNPDLFKKIAEETQKKIKAGKGQTAATMETMREHQEELKTAFRGM